jgi:hypothetical protein
MTCQPILTGTLSIVFHRYGTLPIVSSWKTGQLCRIFMPSFSQWIGVMTWANCTSLERTIPPT